MAPRKLNPSLLVGVALVVLACTCAAARNLKDSMRPLPLNDNQKVASEMVHTTAIASSLEDANASPQVVSSTSVGGGPNNALPVFASGYALSEYGTANASPIAINKNGGGAIATGVAHSLFGDAETNPIAVSVSSLKQLASRQPPTGEFGLERDSQVVVANGKARSILGTARANSVASANNHHDPIRGNVRLRRQSDVEIRSNGETTSIGGADSKAHAKGFNFDIIMGDFAVDVAGHKKVTGNAPAAAGFGHASSNVMAEGFNVGKVGGNVRLRRSPGDDLHVLASGRAYSVYGPASASPTAYESKYLSSDDNNVRDATRQTRRTRRSPDNYVIAHGPAQSVFGPASSSPSAVGFTFGSVGGKVLLEEEQQS